MDGTKRCTHCHEEKPYSEFHKNKLEADGYAHRCKACRKLDSKKRYEENYDEIRAKNAKYIEEHKDERREYMRAWKKENRAKKNAEPIPCRRCGEPFIRANKMKTWYCEACRVIRRKERNAVYHEEHAEQILAWNTAYRNTPERKEHRKEYHKHYFAVNKTKLSEANKKRYQLLKHDPEFQRKAAAARVSSRAERGKTEASHIQHIYAWQEGCCYYCNRVVPKSEREIDHIVPVSFGGSADPHNVVLACHECNSSAEKFNYLVGLEWIPENKNPGHSVLSTLDRQAPDNVTVVSSFWGSGRYLDNPEKLMDDIDSKIIVFDDEWLKHETAIRNMAAAKSGELESVFARKLRVCEIGFSHCKDFFNTYHLQGATNATKYIGLYDGRELKGAASFMFKKGAWELSRLAFAGHVVGGFGKLLSFFRKNFQDGFDLASYVDPRHGNGDSYRLMGFEDMGLTKTPMYFYATPTGIFHRLTGSPKAMQKADFFMEGLNEKTLNIANGRYPIYGKRQMKFLLKG